MFSKRKMANLDSNPLGVLFLEFSIITKICLLLYLNLQTKFFNLQ